MIVQEVDRRVEGKQAIAVLRPALLMPSPPPGAPEYIRMRTQRKRGASLQGHVEQSSRPLVVNWDGMQLLP